MTDQQPLIGQTQWEYPEENPEFEGEQLDSRLKQGPIEERTCTDCIWCILYLGIWALLFAIAIFAFTTGDPAETFAPFISENEQCGIGTQSKCPFAYITVFSTPYQAVCVKACPEDTGQTLSLCDNAQQITAPYGSTDFMGVCSPYNDGSDYVKAFTNLLQFTASQADLDDIDKVWPISLTVCFIALLTSLAVTYLIKWFAKLLVWSVLVLYIITLVVMGLLLFFSANNDISSFHFAGSGWLYALAYILWTFAGLSLLLIVCFAKKIELAIIVMKAAADFTRDVCEATIVPIFMFAFMVGFFIFWVFSSSYLLACGEPSFNPSAPFPTVTLDSGVGWMLAGNFIGFYWNCNFAMAFCQYVIASSCCMWYFHHMGAPLHHPVTKSVTRGLLHHSGSLALGSLILTIVALIRLAFDMVHKVMKDSVQGNKQAEGCLKCWFGYYGCIIKCFEKFIRFLNQNAYIMVALSGQSFCKSAHDAFYLISRNKGKVMVTDGIGELFTTISNLFIGMLSGFIGFIMITQIDTFSEKIASPILPTIFFIMIALVIGSLFMNVYGMGVDTILLCYLADLELYKKEGGAKSVPPALKEFVDAYR